MKSFRFAGIKIGLMGLEQFLESPILYHYLVDDEENFNWLMELRFVDHFQTDFPNQYSKPILDQKQLDWDCRAYYEYGQLVAINYINDEQKKVMIVMKCVNEQKQLDYILPYLSFEKLLWYHHRFILHSSVVSLKDQAIAFIGRSGVGKSTQAALWQNYEKAEMIAGDRSALAIENDIVSVYGIPFDGSAHCYTNVRKKLIGIVTLQQGETEKLERLKGREAFKEVYSQLTINHWNGAYQRDAIDFCVQLVTLLPIYRLTCRISKQAVEIVRGELYGK